MTGYVVDVSVEQEIQVLRMQRPTLFSSELVPLDRPCPTGMKYQGRTQVEVPPGEPRNVSCIWAEPDQTIRSASEGDLDASTAVNRELVRLSGEGLAVATRSQVQTLQPTQPIWAPLDADFDRRVTLSWLAGWLRPEASGARLAEARR